MEPTLSPREIAAQQIRDMAAAIYTELACRVTLAAARADHPKPDPLRLAKVSFNLAEAFQKVQDARQEVKAAASDRYEPTLSEMDSWGEK